MPPTHEVLNQPPPLAGYDLYDADPVLAEALHREGAGWATERVRALGVLAGTPEAIAWAAAADASPPVLRTHDRYGRRVDEVGFHPAWHRLLGTAVSHGLHASPWRDPRPGAQVARAAGFHLWSQVEAGHGCPVSMTFAAVPALRASPELAAVWEPKLTTLAYDPVLAPVAGKAGALCGMAMTEKQGGSDVRANTTRAAPAGDGEWRLTGHKWFCSAPMSDAFLVLAQAPAGLSCFLVPRVLPDGGRNGFHLQRLKDKLGNRANASAEVELDGATGWLVGEPGRGLAAILEMVNHTRLDCVVGSAALMRQAVAQAAHHAAHRSAFGRRLADQPLMANVLADLAVESEAATLLAMRVAGAFDRAARDPAEAALRRLATAMAKYWVCKRAPAVAAEALECLGGNGYVEESGMPRLYREAPLNSIWEGAGNINSLDVLRVLARQPDGLAALLDEVAPARAAEPRLDRAAAAVERELAAAADPVGLQAGARRLVERLAVLLQGALLVRHGHPAVADAFCASRVAGDGGVAFGTLPSGLDLPAIVDRATPKVG
ncbi:MAG TPA: isovaleryl-CoA dehydrogenase [Actinomycetota bacterium]|nr:isovaleryl-CoA dehydrogenase [Actinomycetota bacterium]